MVVDDKGLNRWVRGDQRHLATAARFGDVGSERKAVCVPRHPPLLDEQRGPQVKLHLWGVEYPRTCTRNRRLCPTPRTSATGGNLERREVVRAADAGQHEPVPALTFRVSNRWVRASCARMRCNSVGCSRSYSAFSVMSQQGIEAAGAGRPGRGAVRGGRHPL